MALYLLLALLALAQAATVSALLVPRAREAGRRMGLMDAPNEARKHHKAPIPRSGGLALFAAFWGCLWADVAIAALLGPRLGFLPPGAREIAANIPQKLPQLGAIFLGATLLFLVGVLDDRQGLSPRLRLALQVLSVAPLLVAGIGIQAFLPAPLGWALTVLWVVLLVNSMNFLDNMNGLTSGVCVVACAVLALLAALSREWYMLALFALLAGSALGFWFYNFPRASIFLGDGGSTQIGYLLAVLTALSTYWEAGAPSRLPVLMPLLVLGVPLFDTLSVLWIRWRAGKHFSHRLVHLGMSPVEAVLFIYGATLCVGLAAVALRPLDWRHGLVQVAVVALVFLGIHRIERVARHRPAPPS